MRRRRSGQRHRDGSQSRPPRNAKFSLIERDVVGRNVLGVEVAGQRSLLTTGSSSRVSARDRFRASAEL